MVIYGSCAGSSGSKYNIWLDITQNSQNTTNNTSNITVALKLKRNDGYDASARNGYIEQNTVKLTVNGSVVLSGNMTFDTRNGAVATLGSWTGNVTHDADGKYAKTVSGEFTAGNSSISGGLASGTFTAATIPRASSLTLSHTSRNPTQDITAAITVAAAFSHKITYSIGSYSSVNTIAAGTSSHLFTIPQSWANAVTDKASGTVTVVLQTLSGSTVIGTKIYSFTLAIPDTDTYRPSFTVSLTRINNTVPSGWGVYVQGKSGVSVDITGASYKYGASYKSVEVTVNGIKKITKPSVYNPITISAAVPISVKVTDSRGLSKTETASITAYEYASPTAEIAKTTKGGEGNKANIAFSGKAKISSVGGMNSKTVMVHYRELGGAWTAAESLSDLGTPGNNIVGRCGNDNLSAAKTYEVKITVSDAFVSISAVRKIGSAFCAFNVRKGGAGAAFGKYAETDNVLDIAYDLRVGGKCQTDLLWSSETVSEPGGICTLDDDLFKYRLCSIKTGTATSYLLSFVSPEGYIRANNTWTSNAAGVIEIVSARALYDNTSGYTFTLQDILAFQLRTTGITINSAFTGITQIWGIK